MQAQGLLHHMGGREKFGAAVREHGILLAAHGPYTAEGAGQIFDMEVKCVSKDFRTFDGLVKAIETSI